MGKFGNLVLLVAAVAVASASAQAQRTPGINATVVFGWGEIGKIFSFDWRGMSPTVIYGESKYIEYDRRAVVALCNTGLVDPEDCRKLAKAEEKVEEDVVALQSGKSSAGKVEWIACHLNACSLQQQNGRKFDWGEIKSIQFAPRKDGAGASGATPAPVNPKKMMSIGLTWRDGEGFRIDTDDWDGISPTTAYGGTAHISFDRDGLAALCRLHEGETNFDQCFAQLPQGDPGRDTVLLTSGKTVVGNVEWIACHQNDCVLQRDTGEQLDLAAVRGIRFARANRD